MDRQTGALDRWTGRQVHRYCRQANMCSIYRRQADGQADRCIRQIDRQAGARKITGGSRQVDSRVLEIERQTCTLVLNTGVRQTGRQPDRYMIYSDKQPCEKQLVRQTTSQAYDKQPCDKQVGRHTYIEPLLFNSYIVSLKEIYIFFFFLDRKTYIQTARQVQEIYRQVAM